MLLTLMTFFIILGLLVFVHELGHFITAKKIGVKVDEFGFGYPPRLVGIRKRANEDQKKGWQLIWGRKFKSEDSPTTVYSLNWIPFGGFVKIKGEQGEEREQSDSFAAQPVGRRIIMIVSGVVMNFLLAIILLVICFKIGIPTIIDETVPKDQIRNPKIQIIEVAPGSPAEEASLRIGDILLALDGQPVKNKEEAQSYSNAREDQEVIVTLIRGDQEIRKSVTPRVLSGSDGRAVFGIGLVETGIVSYPLGQSIIKGIQGSFYLVEEIFRVVVEIINNLFEGEKITTVVAGPVGIAVLTGRVVSLGFVYVLQFAALLSINLGIINILPFPALDGGRLVFLFIEKLKGRAVDQKIENLVHNIGFIFLMALVGLVTYKDWERWGDKILEVLKRVLNIG